jgi:hypothetical protein
MSVYTSFKAFRPVFKNSQRCCSCVIWTVTIFCLFARKEGPFNGSGTNSHLAMDLWCQFARNGEETQIVNGVRVDNLSVYGGAIILSAIIYVLLCLLTVAMAQQWNLGVFLTAKSEIAQFTGTPTLGYPPVKEQNSMRYSLDYGIVNH